MLKFGRKVRNYPHQEIWSEKQFGRLMIRDYINIRWNQIREKQEQNSELCLVVKVRANPHAKCERNSLDPTGNLWDTNIDHVFCLFCFYCRFCLSLNVRRWHMLLSLLTWCSGIISFYMSWMDHNKFEKKKKAKPTERSRL